MRLKAGFFTTLALLALGLPASTTDSMNFLLQSPDYVQAESIPGVRVELKYATSDNFTHTNLYGDFKICFMHKLAAEKLRKALSLLHAQYPHYSFLIYDALRPRSVQEVMWGFVKGTPSQKYVADPAIGSMHNYGLALDLTICDSQGRPLDMGAGFDDFREISQPRMEKYFLDKGQLSTLQMSHRMILRNCMERAGFIQLSHEWWHFDALPQKEAFQRFPIVD